MEFMKLMVPVVWGCDLSRCYHLFSNDPIDGAFAGGWLSALAVTVLSFRASDGWCAAWPSSGVLGNMGELLPADSRATQRIVREY